MSLPPGVITFGPKANCNLDICPLEWTIFKYRPSMAASISFISIYSILMLLHIYLGIRWKSWWFMICIVLGCLMEIIGYVGRIILWHNPFSFNGFMLQIICIGCAPVFFTAAIYVTLSMVVQSLDVSMSRLPPKLYYIIFINCDMFSLVFQATGGALSASTSGQNNVAVPLSLTGLILQVVITFIFAILFADYIIRYLRAESRKTNADDKQNLKRLKLFIAFLSAAIVLILARCIYRVAELREGYSGKLMQNEPLFIVLEGVIIVLASCCLLIGHPGFVFVRPESGLKSTLRGNQPALIQPLVVGSESGNSSEGRSAEKAKV